MGKNALPLYNLLACNRRNKIVMSNLVPHEGCVFVSSDISGAEPTILLNYTDDEMLYDILYTYKTTPAEVVNGVFKSSNLYITATSTTEFMRKAMKEAEAKHGKPFVSIYNESSDVAKESLGAVYDTAKALTLALFYGLGANGIVTQLQDRGYPVSKEYGVRFYNDFWSVLPKAAAFSRQQQKVFERAFNKKRCVPNPLGTPLPSGKPKDAMNRVIQSSVSSFVRLLCFLMFTKNKVNFPLRLVCIIHDEIIIETIRENIDNYRNHLKTCVAEANEIIGFKYPLGLGFKVVEDFYAK